MITLIDTSLWIDLTRRKSPRGLRQWIAPYLLDPTAHTADPVAFELLRNALPAEIEFLTRRLEALPRLPSPIDLWDRATEMGQLCRQKGHAAGALDLLISAVAVAHRAVLVTLDEDFEKIGKIVGLEVKFLHRPVGG
jgi:predicted nucleic acid-binding protein